MEFGWINLFGGIIIAVLMLPNVLYALREPGHTPACGSGPLPVLEQIGRYSCMLLMVLPLFVWKFGFGSVPELLVYLGGNALLLTAYLALWPVYWKSRGKTVALWLAVLPTMVFLLSGVLLRHWALVAAAAVFGVSHIAITAQTHT